MSGGTWAERWRDLPPCDPDADLDDDESRRMASWETAMDRRAELARDRLEGD